MMEPLIEYARYSVTQWETTKLNKFHFFYITNKILWTLIYFINSPFFTITNVQSDDSAHN